MALLEGSTFTEVFIQNFSQRSAWNVQVLRTMMSWCWWLFKLWTTAAMFSVDLIGRERVALSNKDLVWIHFTNRSTNRSTALKAFLFYQIFHVNFLQFRLKTHHFGNKFSIFLNFVQATHFVNVKQKTKFLMCYKCYYAFQTQNNR